MSMNHNRIPTFRSVPERVEELGGVRVHPAVVKNLVLEG
jgi:hypothetical protein